MDKKLKRHKKNQPKRGKLLLETSVQIKKLVQTSIKDIILKYKTDSDLYSSYFVLYEFKVGFIYSLIKFYLTVEIHENPTDALVDWSDRFGARKQKNYMLLQALIASEWGDVNSGNKENYLAQIEAAIMLMLSAFHGDVKDLVGDFASNVIVRFKINNKNDFNKFIQLCEEKPDYMLLKDFWLKNQESLKKLLEDDKKYKKIRGSYKSRALERIHTNLLEIDSDIEKANTHDISKPLGDVVIAVDCSKQHTLITLDSSFDTLCLILDKKHIKIPPKRVKAQD